MSRIQADQVKEVAELARLAMTDEEAVMYAEQLDTMFTFGEQLNELDTTGIEPMTHVLTMKNIFREDKVEKGLPIEDVLKNAPEHENGQIRVPTIIE